MAKEKKYSGKTWIRINIFYPLIPFLLEGGIRFFTSHFQITLTTFNAATLAMSIALLCVIVNQNLLVSKPIIPNDDNSEDILGAANQFISYAIFGIAAFTIIVLLAALKEYYPTIDPDTILSIKSVFEYAIYFYAIIPIVVAIRIQKSFKLKATV